MFMGLVNAEVEKIYEGFDMYEHVLDLLIMIDSGYIPSKEENLRLQKIKDISETRVKSIPESIRMLTNLQSLDLSTSPIKKLPENIGDLPNLQYLNLQSTLISELPESIGNLKSLQVLILSDTNIKDLPDSIKNLKKLQTLNISNTKINRLCESIGYLKCLQNLDISYTRIRGLSAVAATVIEKLTNLQSLDLNNTMIDRIPSCIGQLASLQRLNLNHTLIISLPTSIGNLKNLQYINLGYTRINDLPVKMMGLKNLKILELDHTQIKKFPSVIDKLTGLQILNLSYTMLNTPTRKIRNLTNLKSLNLSGTQINKLSTRIDELIYLESLNLSNTRLGELPKNITKLENLQFLDISSTKIEVLPESLGELTSLQTLSLNTTPIKELPESTENLKHLQCLDLRFTQLSDLPESIGYLRELKLLLLEGCSLNELPECLIYLNLEYKEEKYCDSNCNEPGIYINSLKLQKQPVEIFSQSRNLIINYYESMRKDSTLPLNECKVVLLGDGGAGKSLIIDRLMNDGIINPDFDGEATPGICIKSKKYNIGNDEIELHFWDFGGQAIMHSMHRLFLTNRTLYVVVTNARDNKANEQAWYWIRNIKSFANGAPVLLLVNQKDQNPSANVNINGLCKEYPELKKVRIVSALKDTKEAFDKDVCDVICQTVSDMETVYTPFSRSWLSLMNDIQEMSEDYITSEVFYAKCSQNGIETSKEILDEIIKWYQDLGICFYSKAHPISAQYMVLKPRWLLNALYILIFNGRKYAENGIIPETAIYSLICEKVPDNVIKKVCTDITYKTEEIQYIINVLLNFELIYRLDNTHFFIPMLCDENEPEPIDLFESDKAFHVCFKYDYLPENVLHRLMVRHGYELNTDIVWRTGASFERQYCGWSSLVRIKDNCLDIYAKSENQGTHPVNSYLDMVRGSVYKINESIGLMAEEFIAYRKDGKEDTFKYKMLMGILKGGRRETYSEVFDEFIDIDEILGTIKSPDKLFFEELDSQIAALLDSLMDALKKLQGNSTYYDARENKCNSYIRDLLEMRGYSCKDQTLHGISATGKSDGELDILIRDKDRDVDLSIFEALKLKAFGKAEQDNLMEHLRKLLDNYNPEGFSNVFLVSYVSWDKNRFNDLANEYCEYVRRDVVTKFRFTRSRSIDSYKSNYIRCLMVRYDCGGIKMNVFHIIVRVAK